VTLVATKQYAWTQKRTQRKIRISNASKEESSCPSHMICTRIWTVRSVFLLLLLLLLFFDEREGARSKKQERERVVRESVVRRKKINFLRENKKENKQQKNSQLEWLTLILPRPPHCSTALFRTLVHTLIHNFIQYFISSSMPCVSISPYTTFVLILPNTTSY